MELFDDDGYPSDEVLTHTTEEKYQRVDAMHDHYLCMVDMRKVYPTGTDGVIHTTA